MTYTTIQDDRLAAIAWRRYGEDARAIAAIVAANPSLAEMGPVLPAGMTLRLPDLTPTLDPDVIRLWA